jgi:hypothetical protein
MLAPGMITVSRIQDPAAAFHVMARGNAGRAGATTVNPHLVR